MSEFDFGTDSQNTYVTTLYNPNSGQVERAIIDRDTGEVLTWIGPTSAPGGGGGPATTNPSADQLMALKGTNHVTDVVQRGRDIYIYLDDGTVQRNYPDGRGGYIGSTPVKPATAARTTVTGYQAPTAAPGFYSSTGAGTQAPTQAPVPVGRVYINAEDEIPQSLWRNVNVGRDATGRLYYQPKTATLGAQYTPNFGGAYQPVQGADFSLGRSVPAAPYFDPRTGHTGFQNATYNAGLAIGDVLQTRNPYIGPESGVAVGVSSPGLPAILNPQSQQYNPQAYMAMAQATHDSSLNNQIIQAYGGTPTNDPLANAEAAAYLHQQSLNLIDQGYTPIQAQQMLQIQQQVGRTDQPFQFATGGQMMVREPALLIGLASRRPLAMIGEGGMQEMMSNQGDGTVRITPTQNQITMGREMPRPIPLPAPRIGDYTLPPQANPMAQQRAFGQQGMAMSGMHRMPDGSMMPNDQMPGYGRIGIRPLGSIRGFQYGGTLDPTTPLQNDPFYSYNLGPYGGSTGSYNPYVGGYAPLTPEQSTAESLSGIYNLLQSGGTGSVGVPLTGSTYQSSGRTTSAGTPEWLNYYNLRLQNIGAQEGELAQRRASLEGIRPLETTLEATTRSNLEADQAALQGLRPLEQNVEQLQSADIAARQNELAQRQGLVPLENSGMLYRYDRAQVEDPISRLNREVSLAREGRNLGISGAQQSLRVAQSEQDYQQALRNFQQSRDSLNLSDAQSVARYQQAQFDLNDAARRLAEERAAAGANIAGLQGVPGGGTGGEGTQTYPPGTVGDQIIQSLVRISQIQQQIADIQSSGGGTGGGGGQRLQELQDELAQLQALIVQLNTLDPYAPYP